MDIVLIISIIVAGFVCYQLYNVLGQKNDDDDNAQQDRLRDHLRQALDDEKNNDKDEGTKTRDGKDARDNTQSHFVDQNAVDKPHNAAKDRQQKPEIKYSKDQEEGLARSAALAAEAQMSDKPQPQWIQDVRAEMPAFDGDHFMEGAKSAYEMIVTAFADNAMHNVKPFISEEIFTAFHAAAQARQKAGHKAHLDFVGIEKADVKNVRTENGQLLLSVAFVSDQIRATKDSAGEVINGDLNRIDSVHDEWEFAKDLNSYDPNWTLVATH